MIDIREHAAGERRASYRIVPCGLGFFNDHCAKQSVNIRTEFIAKRVSHVGEEIYAFSIRIPSVLDKVVGGGIGVESHIGAIGRFHIVGQPLYMNGSFAIQPIVEVDADLISDIGADDKGLVPLRKAVEEIRAKFSRAFF